MSIQSSISGNIDSGLDTLRTTSQKVIDPYTNLKGSYKQQASDGDYMRNIGLLVIFILPATSILAVLVGGIFKSGCPFTTYYWIGYVGSFLVFLMFAIHLPVAVVLSDGCTYVSRFDANFSSVGMLSSGSPAPVRACCALLSGRPFTIVPLGDFIFVFSVSRLVYLLLLQGEILNSCMTNSSLLGLIKTGGTSLESQLNFSSSIQFADFSSLASDFTFPLIDNFTASVANLSIDTFFTPSGQTEAGQPARLTSAGCAGTYSASDYWTNCPSDANFNSNSNCKAQCTLSQFFRNVTVWLPTVKSATTVLGSTYVDLRAQVVGVNAKINGVSQSPKSVRDTITPLLSITNQVCIS